MNRIKSSLRVSEIDTLAAAFVRLYQAEAENETLAKDGNLKAMMSDVENLSARLTAAIKCDRAESSLDEADIVRDEIIRNLSNALLGYASIPIPEKKAPARRLLSIFKKYGKGIISKTYAEESSLIESMLGDFSVESAQADAKILEGVGELLSSLRSAQDEFHRLDDIFITAKTEKGENASEVKKELLVLINVRLLSYLTALEQIPGYAGFIAKYSLEIDRANSTAENRSKQAAPETAETAAENLQDVAEDPLA